MAWCRGCGSHFELPRHDSDSATYHGESIYCENCDGAAYERELKKIDANAAPDEMDRFLELVEEHGLFEAEAIMREAHFAADVEIDTLFLPDE